MSGFFTKSFLLSVYFLYLLVTLRFLELTPWFDIAYYACQAVDPLTVSVSQLKAILSDRGISLHGVVETSDMIQLIEDSGDLKYGDFLHADDVSAESLATVETKVFTSSYHFREEVEDAKDSVWIVQVVPVGRQPLLDDKEWLKLNAKVSRFGIRTGIFQCSHDRSYCKRKNWTQPLLLMAVPKTENEKGSVAMTTFTSATVTQNVLSWISKQLSTRVVEITDISELSSVWSHPDDMSSPLRFVFVSSPDQQVPMILSALSVRFPGRVKFGHFTVNDSNHDEVAKFVNVDRLPTYLLFAPRFSLTYGSQRGQFLNYNAMELFLTCFSPSINDIFILILLFINMIAGFEIFISPGGVISRIFKLIWTIVVYNCMVILSWLPLIFIFQLKYIRSVVPYLLKIDRWLSSTSLASLIRQDYLIFGNYPSLCVVAFLTFGMLLMFIQWRFECFYSPEEAASRNIASHWFYIPNSAGARFFFRNNSGTGLDNIDAFVEEGYDIFIERLATPDFWLQPLVSNEYINYLPLWHHTCKPLRCSTTPGLTQTENESNPVSISSDPPLPCEGGLDPGGQRRGETGSGSQSLSAVCRRSLRRFDPRLIFKRRPSPVETERNSSPAQCPCRKMENPANPSFVRSEYCVTQKPSNILDSVDCVICLDVYSVGGLLCGLHCGHTFHYSCISTWLTRGNYHCPVCRWPTFQQKSSHLRDVED